MLFQCALVLLVLIYNPDIPDSAVVIILFGRALIFVSKNQPARPNPVVALFACVDVDHEVK